MPQKRKIAIRKLKELYEQDLTQVEIAKRLGVTPAAVSIAIKKAGFASIESRIKQGITFKVSKEIAQGAGETKKRDEEINKGLAQMISEANTIYEAVKGEMQNRRLTDRSIRRFGRAQKLVEKSIFSYLKFQQTHQRKLNLQNLSAAICEFFPTLNSEEKKRFQEFLQKHGIFISSNEFTSHGTENVSRVGKL
ncbi:MAG: hypothetical protein WBZ48_08170 [Bacteroidota bacterium]